MAGCARPSRDGERRKAVTAIAQMSASPLRIGAACLSLAMAALAALFLISTPWQMPAAGLDPSWRSTVEYAYLQGLVFGRDFTFTSGPLSFVHTHYFHPRTFPWVAAAMLHAAAVYTVVVLSVRPRGLAILVAGLLVICFAPLNPDALYMSLPLAIFLLTVTQAAPAWIIAVLVAGLALSGLAKFSILMLAMPLLVLADLAALVEGRRRCWHAAIYGLSVVSLYAASGQPLGALPEYFLGSLDFASGYGQSMANFFWTAHQAALALVCAGLLATAFGPVRRDLSVVSVSCVLAFAWYLFLAFKLGNVRAGHQYITWHALAAAGFLLVLLPHGSSQRAGRPAFVAGAWVLACFCIYQAFVPGFHPATVLKDRTSKLSAVVSSVAAWLAPTENFERLARQRRAADERLAAQAPRDLAGSIGSLPWEFSELIAAGLPFVPSPALQTYANYTPRLREATQRQLEGDGRPDHLFFQLATIDGRFRTTDLGPSLVAVLAGYDAVRRHSRLQGGPMQLRRRAHRRQVKTTAGDSRTAAWGDWVEVPRPGAGALMLALKLDETLAGRLMTLAYKQEPFDIDLRFANGTVVSARGFPSLVADGFLVVPPEMTEAQLFAEAARGFELGRSNPPVAFRLRPPYLGAFRFAARYQFTTSAIRIDGSAEHPLLEEALPATAMQALIEGRVVASPEIRLLHDRLLAHAPSKIVAVMPKGGRLDGEIGFFDGSWQSGQPRPVTFSISRLTPSGTRPLFQRTLDPVANRADRGHQAFSIDIGPGAPGGERIELLFETGPETSWGWTYWSRLRLAD
jgi:hypothetical protein